MAAVLSDFREAEIMFNGRKNTVIGLSAIFTFVLVELAAIVSTVALVLAFVWRLEFLCFPEDSPFVGLTKTGFASIHI